jgi:hypothetical protein
MVRPEQISEVAESLLRLEDDRGMYRLCAYAMRESEQRTSK